MLPLSHLASNPFCSDSTKTQTSQCYRHSVVPFVVSNQVKKNCIEVDIVEAMPTPCDLKLPHAKNEIDPWSASPVSSSIDYILDNSEQSSEINADSDILFTPRQVASYAREESIYNPFGENIKKKEICEEVLKELQYSAIELSVECRDLLKLDFFAKHDSIAVVMTEGVISGTWEEWDRSEIVINNNSPRYVKKFRLPASSKMDQDTVYLVRIYNATPNVPLMRDADILGYTSFSISELLDSSQMDRTSNLISPRSGRKKGDILLSLDTIHHVQESENIIFDFGMLSPPTCKDQFEFVVSRTLKQGRFFPIYRSEPQSGQMCCKFNDAEIRAQDLHGGDPFSLFRIELHQYGKDGRPEQVGYAQVSSEKLKSCAPGAELYWWSSRNPSPVVRIKILNLRIHNGCQWYMLRLVTE